MQLYLKPLSYFLLIIPYFSVFAQKIDRKTVVERHIVRVNEMDTLSSLSVGNGKFAFTVDATGLQTFPEFYQNGVPLGTQSEWGWHSFPNTDDFEIEESLKDMESHGRKIPYMAQWNEPERKKLSANYFRQNPHRLQLGNIGFELIDKNGSVAKVVDIQGIKQELNPFTGIIKSSFVFDNERVDVETTCHQNKDLVGVKIKSNLLKNNQLKIRVRLPFPTDKFIDAGTNYQNPDHHSSEFTIVKHNVAFINHQLDTTKYLIKIASKNSLNVIRKAAHDFLILANNSDGIAEFTFEFSDKNLPITQNLYSEIYQNNVSNWQKFWFSGGAIDFSGSTNPLAKELERRVVLSQYLTKIQCTGFAPPQETGLTYNSWFGKPHLEMHWWHSLHFALWGRIEYLEQTMNWYNKTIETARRIAKRQGFEGVRWQKMTDNEGRETASSVGAYLLWQQPHIITFAELVYRQKPTPQTLEKYKQLVFETADFMASFAYFDKEKGRYILGKGIIPAQERFKPETTFNPTYELSYWHWALTTAQNWRKRLGLKPNPKYQEVLDKISPLPVQDGVYLATENATDSYTNPVYLTDHPAVLCTYGMLPKTPLLDKQIMQNTFDKVWKIWHWDETWGWDFPMVAMTASRLGNQQKVVEALLMNIRTNTYLSNGHNFQDERLRLYLPGNGGLLAAVAMMCAGYDDSSIKAGFPQDGTWKVRWEGLKRFF